MANEPKALVIAVVVSAALVAVAFGVSLDNEFLYWEGVSRKLCKWNYKGKRSSNMIAN